MAGELPDFEVRGLLSRSGQSFYAITRNGRTAYVRASEFVRSESAALAKLIEQGIPFVGPKRAALRQQVAKIDNFEPSALIDRIGHNPPYFAYPDGTVFGPQDVPPGTTIFEPQLERCHESGTFRRWKRRVAAPLAGHPICEFFMMVPFAGPLRHYTTRSDNFGWELVGPKGTGKTVLLHLAASACGGAKGGQEGAFGLSFAATAAGIQQEMQNYSDLALLINEGTLFLLSSNSTMRGRAFSELLMMLGEGREKRTYNSSPRAFRFVFATTANESLLEVIGGTSSAEAEDAVTDRLLTISLAGRPLGIFDHLPDGFSGTSEFIGRLVAAQASQHGTAMRHYLRVLMELAHVGRTDFAAKLDRYLAKFREKADQIGGGSSDRVVDSFGLVYAAGKLAKLAGVLPGSFNPLQSTTACYRLHVASKVAVVRPAERVLALWHDPATVDLDAQSVLTISDDEFSRVSALKRTCGQRFREIIVPKDKVERLIPGWDRIRREDAAIAQMVVRDGDHFTTWRKVRKYKRDRVVCFRIPLDNSP